ncbi:hypothetical protein SAMN05216456_0412 [Devosia crocina]|uniref:Uncharacterized protein n=1 Tax=Devosia crocina TaxID=429728 RepID=A0A1I7N021_9HYPH|nr:hypothetical protein [Devosia crocina]SFV28002.1 hypothetical protein SAMN05216456_0412 [Devosia crocina]
MARNELDPDVLAGVERFIADQDRPPHGRMSREEAIATIVSDWLMGQGYLPLPGDDEGVTTALEAAEVPKP